MTNFGVHRSAARIPWRISLSERLETRGKILKRISQENFGGISWGILAAMYRSVITKLHVVLYIVSLHLACVFWIQVCCGPHIVISWRMLHIFNHGIKSRFYIICLLKNSLKVRIIKVSSSLENFLNLKSILWKPKRW